MLWILDKLFSLHYRWAVWRAKRELIRTGKEAGLLPSTKLRDLWRGYSDRDLEVAKQIQEVRAGMRPGSYIPMTRGELYALNALQTQNADRTNASADATRA